MHKKREKEKKNIERFDESLCALKRKVLKI